MKKETVKLIKKTAREKIPVSSLKGSVILSRKKKLIDKASKKEARLLGITQTED